MAWVNRASRERASNSVQAATAAAAHLGPGCYDSSPLRRVKPNAAPFGTSAPALTEASERSFVTPGPGAYAPEPVAAAAAVSPSKSLQAAVFASRTDRESSGVSRYQQPTPGPGAYVTRSTFGNTATARNRKKSKKKMLTTAELATNQESGAGSISSSSSHGAVQWKRLPTAPSIPTQAQSFGYAQNPQGKFVRHEPSELTEDTASARGPGVYDSLRGLKSLSKARATDFAKSKVGRSFDQEIRAKAELPGPGHYGTQSTTPAERDAHRSSATFKSVPRDQNGGLPAGGASTSSSGGSGGSNAYHVPGPGAYYDSAKGFASQPAKPEHLQFFGSTTNRFEAASREVAMSPGPGAYYYAPPVGNSASLSLSPCQRKHKSVSRHITSRGVAPFSSKKERFQGAAPKEEYTAAPGSYNIPTAMHDVLNKVTSRVSTFGSTTKRFDTLSQPPEATRETSGARLERELRAMAEDTAMKQSPSGRGHAPPKGTTHSAPSSVFASSSTRFGTRQASTTTPSPGDYQVASSWNAPGATGIFKSATHRMVTKQAKGNEVPGPGAYTAPTAVVQKPLHMARPDVFVSAVRFLETEKKQALAPRFEKKTSKVPSLGPGQYSAHSAVENEWNRPTYNITIATEMELAMLK